MSLEQQLAQIREGGAKRIPADKREIMHRAVEALRASGAAARAAKPGDRLPEFALEDAAGVEVRSADLLARGAVVLTVFRGSW